ncbi:GNAT family N-acetyltransferase [Anaerosporobacter sp.]|uniref:GNAT family N-acetyltransferase n=1 Tax=Anaerosporobacter sp. TaxID=1872529 RepID=UPI00286F01DB|nr:GNAT family N-acetyltransferase [Anaerosporobacter sp.]
MNENKGIFQTSPRKNGIDKGEEMEVLMKQCTENEIGTLHEFSCKTFIETYGSKNTPENMQFYLDNNLNIEKLRADLLSENVYFYFLYTDDELSGYVKLNVAPAQTDINDEKSLEIERIYVAEEFQGKGLGKHLMNKAIEVAKEKKKEYIWLGVWDQNEKAIRFYKKHDFQKAGEHSFFLGDEKQVDYIMRRCVI